MKKLCLVIGLFLVLTSCDQSYVMPSQPSEEVTLLRVVLPGSIDELTDITNELEILCDVTQISDDYFDALKIKLQSDDPPTLFYLDDISKINEISYFLEDLSYENWAKELYPNTQSYLAVDGHILAMPDKISGVGVIYNSEIFKKANINPQNLNSQTRFAQAIAVLNARVENGDFSLTYPNLKSVYTNNAEKLIQNRAVMTFSLSDEYEDTENLRLLPIYLDGILEEKILLKIDGVWCVNKNASQNEKTQAKLVLSQLYNVNFNTENMSPILNDVKTFALKAQTEIFDSELYENILSQMEDFFAIASEK